MDFYIKSFRNYIKNLYTHIWNPCQRYNGYNLIKKTYKIQFYVSGFVILRRPQRTVNIQKILNQRNASMLRNAVYFSYRIKQIDLWSRLKYTHIGLHIEKKIFFKHLIMKLDIKLRHFKFNSTLKGEVALVCTPVE